MQNSDVLVLKGPFPAEIATLQVIRDSSLYTSWLNLSIIRSLNLQFPTASTRPINEHIVLDDDNNVNSTSILTSISDRNSRLILQTKRPFNIKVNASCLMLLQARNPFNIKVLNSEFKSIAIFLLLHFETKCLKDLTHKKRKLDPKTLNYTYNCIHV